MCVARNVCKDPRLVPGGGAVEMAVSRHLNVRSASVEGIEAGPYRAVGSALEVIPRTLAQNCGANVIRVLTKLRAQHAAEPRCTFGIDGNSGEACLHSWEPCCAQDSSGWQCSITSLYKISRRWRRGWAG